MSIFDPHELHRRASIARGVVVVAFLVLMGAFFRTQIIQHEEYQLAAESNRLRAVPLPAPRGAVVDRNGELIAENVPGYTVKLLAASADSLEAVLKRLGQIVALDSTLRDDTIRRWRQARWQPVTVFNDADFKTASRIEEHRALLPGLVMQSEPRRLYPGGKAVAHLVGYVSEVSDAELKGNRFPGAALGSIVGRSGIERSYDDTLRGREGVRYIEVNSRGGLVRDDASLGALAPEPGRELRTTIDLNLQKFIDSIWPPNVRGAMLAVTPSGEIRALYSSPTYDPNLFVGGIAAGEYRALLRDPANPLINRAINGRYPPASPFKLATAAMALRRGIVNFHSHMDLPCRGGFRLGNRVFRCWKKEGHGSLDLTGAVAKSCDVYFYQLGLKLGLDAIVKDGVLMGFRDRSGVDLPAEQAPIFPAGLDYFDRKYGPRNWSPPATILNFAIGQGENTQTLVNMVKFYAALASDGKIRSPYVVTPGSAPSHDVGLTPNQLEGLRHALIAVVEGGTAAASRRTDLQVAGKTGTAQNSADPKKDHGWFIGFAPAEDPQIVIGAIMEFAEHGSSVAPYVVKAIRRYLLGPEAPAPPRRDIEFQVDSAPRDLPIEPDSLAAEELRQSQAGEPQ